MYVTPVHGISDALIHFEENVPLANRPVSIAKLYSKYITIDGFFFFFFVNQSFTAYTTFVRVYIIIFSSLKLPRRADPVRLLLF